MVNKNKFYELVEVFKVLRGPKGCMWDRIQTHKSLMKYLREEVEEFAEAVKKNNYLEMKDELGDVLLNIVFHAQIADESGKFDIDDVVDNLIKKLKRRHPHVFGKTRIKSVNDIIVNWDKIKQKEKTKTKK
jgi:tetrapyrrole methylase family protein/MazG family protein